MVNKRILYINESLNTGSTGHIVEKLGLHAQANGDTCMVAHGARYVRPSQLPHYGFSTKIEEYIHGVISLFGNAHGLGSRFATKRLIRFIRGWKPDIIHLHNIHGYYLNYSLLFDYLKEAKIPVVWTLHDCWAFTGRCAYFTLSGCAQWKKQCSHCPTYSDYPRSVIPWHTSSNFLLKKQAFSGLPSLTIVPVSNWLSGHVQQSFLRTYPRHTIYNGIDTKLFRPEVSDLRSQWNAEDKVVLLGVASQWTETKGWSDWLKLVRSLDNGYCVVMVGVTKSQANQLPSWCIAIPQTEDIHQLVQIYSAADVYINLAHQEAFGLTLLEAMACGTPCISYRTTAIPETTTEDTCIMVEEGDLNGIIETVQSKGRMLKQERSEICRQHVVAHFNEENKIEEYENIYNHHHL